MANPNSSANDRLVSRIVIRGRIEDVWRELTKQGEPQAAIFNAWLHAQRLAPGAKLAMRTRDGQYTLVIGEVLDFDPPRRFAHTFRFTQYDDAPCTVIYELKPVADGVEVSLIVENMPAGTRTALRLASEHSGGRFAATPAAGSLLGPLTLTELRYVDAAEVSDFSGTARAVSPGAARRAHSPLFTRAPFFVSSASST